MNGTLTINVASLIVHGSIIVGQQGELAINVSNAVIMNDVLVANSISFQSVSKKSLITIGGDLISSTTSISHCFLSVEGKFSTNIMDVEGFTDSFFTSSSFRCENMSIDVTDADIGLSNYNISTSLTNTSQVNVSKFVFSFTICPNNTISFSPAVQLETGIAVVVNAYTNNVDDLCCITGGDYCYCLLAQGAPFPPECLDTDRCYECTTRSTSYTVGWVVGAVFFFAITVAALRALYIDCKSGGLA